MRDVARKLGAEGAGDSIAQVIPPALWRIRTAGGEPLDGIHVFAWRWLADRTAGRPWPCAVEFRAVDLAARFNRRSHASALQWIAALESAGLVGDVECERGACGTSRLRMYDPDEVLGRGELAARQADAQLELDLGIDETEQPAVVRFGEPDGSPTITAEAGKCCDAEQHHNISAEHVAAERPDVPPALWGALQVHLGESIAEVYLGLARFQLAGVTASGNPGPHRILLPSEYLRNYVRKHYRASIEQAFADANLAGEVELEIGEAIRRDDEQHRNISAQQPTLVRNPSRVSNQPTNQPIAAQGEKLHPLLRSAAELYRRIGDPSLWKWVAIATVLMVDDGKITSAEVDGLIRTAGDDFGSAIKTLAGQRRAWPKQGALKSRLRAHGIKWKRSWERGEVNHQPKERR